MGFAVKKLIAWLISPLGMSLALLGAGLACSFAGRRQGLARALLAAAFLVKGVFNWGPVADALSRPLESRYKSLALTAPLGGIPAAAVLNAGGTQAQLGRLVEESRVLRIAPGSRLVVPEWGGRGHEATAEVQRRNASGPSGSGVAVIRGGARRGAASCHETG